MRRLLVSSFAFLLLVGFGGTVTEARAQGKKPVVSAEMKDFMTYLTGDSHKVDEGLKKYVAEGVDVSSMEGIAVREPKITKTEESKDHKSRSYTVAVKTGILDRVYLISWKEKKIQEIKQLSIQ